MIIGILTERTPEKRVAITPDGAKILINLGNTLYIENGAGDASFFTDTEYAEKGVKVTSRAEVLSNAECIAGIHGISESEFDSWSDNKVLIGHLMTGKIFVDKLMNHKITSFSLDLLPRSTLAQSMDILSSMATVSGYKAILDAANHLPRFFPMFMTASGTIKPAKVLILGAGVAGLQALATARRLGAVVEVFDVRSAVKEEVNSLGGKFIEVEGAREDSSAGGYAVEQQEDYKKRQGELIQKHATSADVIICTAQIPGKKAPVLITAKTVESMSAGSVIVDLAASTGGNCELTVHNSNMVHKGVMIIGKVDYPSSLTMDASRMYSNNMVNFIKTITDASGNYKADWNNEIVKKSCVTHDGKIENERIKTLMSEQL